MVIGVTGKYCAGKNEATQRLISALSNGDSYTVIDVDSLGHRALDAEKETLVEAFSEEILSPQGQISRKALGRIVFSDPRELEKLESIVHPRMVEEVKRRIRESSGNAVIHAAILGKMGLTRLCHAVLWVEAPLPLRLLRGMKRDNLNLFQVIRRICAQRKLTLHSLPQDVDIYTVKNSRNIGVLEKGIRNFIEEKDSK